jgi:threonine/homoserine/homoserine lactone efflux protein
LLELEFFFKGLLIGLTIAAPVGPVGILCLRRTLTHGRMAGLASGLGAAFADTFYGILAIFGLSIISDVLLCCLPWFEFVGALFLLILGINTYFKKLVVLDEPRGSIHTLLGYFTSTFFLTLTNPVTMFAFLAIFSAIGYTGGENLFTGSLMLLGVFLGSMIWWLLIGEGTTFFRKRMSQNLLLYINKFAGLLLIVFGLIILINWIYNI